MSATSMFDPTEVKASGDEQLLFEIDSEMRLAMLPLAKLRIDPVYQRDLVGNLVEKIAEAYKPKVSGAILVSERPSGDWYIIDGQHRAAGATRAGETHILSLVVRDAKAAEEATDRLASNTKRTDKGYEVFRAKLAAGDKEAKAIKGICDTFETQINTQPLYDEGINAIAAVEHLYRLDKGQTLVRVFELIQDTWGKVGGEHATATVMKGLAFFLLRHGSEVQRPRLVDRLQTEGVGALSRAGRSHKAVSGGALWVNFYRAVVEAWNHKLSDPSKIESRTGGWSVAGLGRGTGIEGWE